MRNRSVAALETDANLSRKYTEPCWLKRGCSAKTLPPTHPPMHPRETRARSTLRVFQALCVQRGSLPTAYVYYLDHASRVRSLFSHATSLSSPFHTPCMPPITQCGKIYVHACACAKKHGTGVVSFNHTSTRRQRGQSPTRRPVANTPAEKQTTETAHAPKLRCFQALSRARAFPSSRYSKHHRHRLHLHFALLMTYYWFYS